MGALFWLIGVEDALNFLRVVGLGQRKHQQDAALLRVQRVGHHQSQLFVIMFAVAYDHTATSARRAHDGNTGLNRCDNRRLNGFRDAAVASASVDNAFRTSLDRVIDDTASWRSPFVTRFKPSSCLPIQSKTLPSAAAILESPCEAVPTIGLAKGAIYRSSAAKSLGVGLLFVSSRTDALALWQ